LVSIVVLVYRFSFLQGPVAVVALGAAIGGATGNLVDVMRRGAVVDFIDVRVWPVFNLADAAIVAGLLAAAVSIAFVA
jgi:signal peptidase II